MQHRIFINGVSYIKQNQKRQAQTEVPLKFSSFSEIGGTYTREWATFRASELQNPF